MTNIDVLFEGNLEDVISRSELIQAYTNEYNKIVDNYKDFFREGKGYKTNKYHEPVMNFAYNYIKHDDFKRIAREPTRGYNRYGQAKSTPRSYYYYLSVWSIACLNVEKLYNNQFQLKFDHRYNDRKNNDFDGYLVCFKNFQFWKNRNLPNKQRY